MLAVRQYSTASSLVLLSLLACDRRQPVEPGVEAAFTAAWAPTVKAPSNTNAVAASESRIEVGWQDNSPNEAGFEVHRSANGPGGTFTLRASTGANVTNYSDTGVDPLTQYCYKVRAFRRADGKTGYSDFSNTACATTPAPPAPTAPSGADAKPGTSTSVDVRWSDNSTNEDGFRVERSLDAGATWATAGTVGPNVASFSEAGLASEQQVCYRVIAFNRGGDSPPSNTDCATPPAAPSGLTAATAQQGIDLAWTDNSAVEHGYEVQRATDGVSFSAVADLPANSTTYHDARATANATYWYRVRAKKDGGFSDPSNIASAEGGCVPTSDTEVCDNSLDDNCDGLIDAEDVLSCSGCEVAECTGGCPGGTVCELFCCVPHCGDGVRNGDEGDMDCGGSCPIRCQTGQQCNTSFDCASFSCVNGVCQP